MLHIDDVLFDCYTPQPRRPPEFATRFRCRGVLHDAVHIFNRLGYGNARSMVASPFHMISSDHTGCRRICASQLLYRPRLKSASSLHQCTIRTESRLIDRRVDDLVACKFLADVYIIFADTERSERPPQDPKHANKPVCHMCKHQLPIHVREVIVDENLHLQIRRFYAMLQDPTATVS